MKEMIKDILCFVGLVVLGPILALSIFLVAVIGAATGVVNKGAIK